MVGRAGSYHHKHTLEVRERQGIMYIYLLREREFRRLDEPVWKPGRTVNIANRMRQYPKGSELILALQVHDAVAVEREIMKLLAAHPEIRRRTDIGAEYFEGPFEVVQGIMLMMCARHGTPRSWKEDEDVGKEEIKECVEEEEAEEEVKDTNDSEQASVGSPTDSNVMDEQVDVIDSKNDNIGNADDDEQDALDADRAVLQFVRDLRERLSCVKLPPEEVLLLFKGWLHGKNVHRSMLRMQINRLTYLLSRIWKVKNAVSMVNGQVEAVLKFPKLIADDNSQNIGESVVEERKSLSEWLEERVRRGNKNDFVLIRDLKDSFIRESGDLSVMSEFTKAASSWFVSKKFVFKACTRVKQIDGTYRSERNVVFGAIWDMTP